MRFDTCLCGTTTIGTGTLTLAACPTPPGGVDFDVWARVAGIGFGNSAALLVDYQIVEFTNSNFTTRHQSEAGTGTLTLGSSSGIVHCTLARTTIDYTATSQDVQPASVSIKPATGITIGTAANTLVMVTPRALSVPGYHPYYDSANGDANWGISPFGSLNPTAVTAASSGFTAGAVRDWYIPFRWEVPMLVKRCTVRVFTFTSVTGTPILNIRLYAYNSAGQPGKLLYDFGATPTITATGNVATGAAGNGYLMEPGDYFLDLCSSGLTAGTLTLAATGGTNPTPVTPAAMRIMASAGTARQNGLATGASGAAPDPANLTSFSWTTGGNMVFGLSPV
jgi:hypothetical protein